MELFKFGKKARRRHTRMGEPFENDLVSHVKYAGLQQDEAEAEPLKYEVERLNSVCRALWSFIKEHHDLSEADLKKRFDQLKQQEGEHCTRCGRVVTKSQKRCLYCGAEGQERESLF